MKNKKIPMRTCVGCRESKPKKELLRMVKAADGKVMVDRTGKLNGRGIYLCRNTECFEKAKKKKAIGRGLELNINDQAMEELYEDFIKE